MNWDNHPEDGEVWTLYCSGDVVPGAGNTFSITSSAFAFGARKLDNIKVVPNPYIVRNPWEVSSDYGELRFTNLPDECEIRIYTLAGNLIKTLDHKVEATAASAIQGIIDIAKEMKQAPVRLLDHVEEVIQELSESHRLMLVTKGDLLDQERKILQSGLASCFDHIEVVTDKTAEIYRALLAKHSIPPERFIMVGNSLRGDILPVVSLGARAVYIPYHLTWAHEAVPVHPDKAAGYLELDHSGLLPELVGRLEGHEPHVEQSSMQKEAGH